MVLLQKKYEHCNEQMPKTETHWEIETHHFNTVWLIIGICLVLLLVVEGLSESWLFAAAWFHHTGSVWDQALLCARGEFWNRGQCSYAGPVRGPHSNISSWNIWSLGGLSGKRRFSHGREGEGAFVSAGCGCSGLNEDALGHFYSYMIR